MRGDNPMILGFRRFLVAVFLQRDLAVRKKPIDRCG